jgi:hypothetical protein
MRFWTLSMHPPAWEAEPVDAGREVRGDKDAVTVEIVFALVTGGALAAVVFAAGYVGVRVLGVSGGARGGVLTVSAGVAALCGGWRVVRVLRRFEAWRRQGS